MNSRYLPKPFEDRKLKPTEFPRSLKIVFLCVAQNQLGNRRIRIPFDVMVNSQSIRKIASNYLKREDNLLRIIPTIKYELKSFDNSKIQTIFNCGKK
jgi:hypothetical protein